MSAQQLPCIKLLREQVEKDVARASAKFKENDLGELDTNQQQEKGSTKKEQSSEVRLNIPEHVIPAAKPNIFAERPASEPRINIFGNSKSVNLFSLSQQNNSEKALNIFAKAMTASPAIAINEPDDLSENSQGSQRSHQQLKEPTERVMKFEYQQRFERLGQYRLIKFRAGVGAVKEGVLVSLEREINKPEKVLHLVLRSEITKVVVYHAFLLPGTKAEHFMGKKENLKFPVLRVRQEDKKEGEEEKNDDEKQKGQGKQSKIREEREQVKLQFQKEEDATAFDARLTQFFSQND